MYFSIAKQPVEAVHITQGKKVRKFCYNQKTDQLLIILSKKQWIVYFDISKSNQEAKKIKDIQITQYQQRPKPQQIFKGCLKQHQIPKHQVNQSEMEDQCIYLKQKQDSDSKQSQQNIINGYAIQLDIDEIPLQLQAYSNFFVWLSKDQNKLYFILFQQTWFGIQSSKIKKYQIMCYQLCQPEFLVHRKLYFINQEHIIIVNRGKYQNFMVIQQYYFSKNSSKRAFIQKGKSQKMPLDSYKICKWVSQYKSLIIFGQNSSEDKIQVIKFGKQSDKVPSNQSEGIFMDSYDIECITQQQRGTCLIIDTHIIMDTVYIVINTASDTQVKQSNWQIGDKRFIAPGYLTIFTFQLGQSLIMLVRDRFTTGQEKFIVINIKSFQLVHQYTILSPIQKYYCGSSCHKILCRTSKNWQIYCLIPKQITYLKFLTTLSTNQSQEKRVQQSIKIKDFSQLESLYEHVLALL